MAPQLGALVPVFVFGFLLCPYLDLTFHHACQQTRGRITKLSFAVGFGLFFAAMLVFALLYAPSVIAFFFGQTDAQKTAWSLVNRPALQNILFIHFGLQAGYTLILHLHRLRIETGGFTRRRLLWALTVALPIGLFVLLDPVQTLPGLSLRELIYRLFLGYYGLVAPVYVWTCVIPFKTRGISPKADWATCAATILLALPFFAWAFMAETYHALIPGIILVLAAPLGRRFYLRGRSRTS
jgi:hypothetical protein